MTQKDKELLLKDLCARLSSMVRVEVDDEYMEGVHVLRGYEFGWFVVEGRHYDIDEVTPYLRPMSSMTDEERDEFRSLGGVMSYSPEHDRWAISAFAPEAYDYLNSHHFDYRGLIEKGLALEAPEDMYKQ